MNYRHIALSAALSCIAITPAAAGEPRAVIELFTSQDGNLPAMKYRGAKSDWHNGMFAATVRRP